MDRCLVIVVTRLALRETVSDEFIREWNVNDEEQSHDYKLFPLDKAGELLLVHGQKNMVVQNAIEKAVKATSPSYEEGKTPLLVFVHADQSIRINVLGHEINTGTYSSSRHSESTNVKSSAFGFLHALKKQVENDDFKILDKSIRSKCFNKYIMQQKILDLIRGDLFCFRLNILSLLKIKECKENNDDEIKTIINDIDISLQKIKGNFLNQPTNQPAIDDLIRETEFQPLDTSERRTTIWSANLSEFFNDLFSDNSLPPEIWTENDFLADVTSCAKDIDMFYKKSILLEEKEAANVE